MHSLKFASLAVALLVGTGCNSVPQTTYRQAHFQAYRQYQTNRMNSHQVGALQSELARANADRDALRKKLADKDSELDTSNKRLVNLQNERGELKQRYIDLLKKGNNGPSQLTPTQTKQFEDLAKRHPDFEFDPETGVGKFHSDILFPIGSDVVRSDAHPVLKDFASVLNTPGSTDLQILVVGHTDDRQIAKMTTIKKHPTNWHLSTNRANAVVATLNTFGLSEHRMGAAGYSMFQPVLPNTDEQNRTRNRRVEIFILAPEASIAGWNPNGVVTE